MAAANIPSLVAFVAQGIRYGRDIVRRERPDIINTHFALPSGPVGDVLAQEIGCPNILSVHGGDLYDPSRWTSPHKHWLLRKWIAHLMRKADHVVGQSADTVRRAHTYYVPGLKTDQIPLGIARPPRIDADRKDWGFGDEDVILVTVGRLVGRKSIDQLIEMMPHLPEGVRLMIVGDGPMRPELQALSESLGINHRVRFMGSVSELDKFRLLKVSDVFVSTSQHEGFGLVFLEAMASNLPVVSYDKGGQTDFLEDGVTGRLIRVGQRETFKKALLDLLADPGRYKAMARRNQEIVEAFYIEHCARQYEELFEATLEGRQ
ncbi:MAG: glycosyltransferase family 4 protein [Geminicoccaceae bacterium]|nr:glycosyltransferase family 4 protein [Geminicoccaceae bacterium]